ncbi:hypothetical protein P9G84_02570 [Brevibacillus centrosporus]|uniref:hypothetical protein n=1 Tax=Brevibacillus centrosporus TaxID=54910 RepID=UPI0011444224|nr:hypothetical protein [Brevibacillus centrosporus]MEC2127878.1 hypothetical protein [Brevibacillus centrosporus]GED32123.1 hypothetical protein BCE02nite_32640 [Brevibacillus centrosporus]
MRELVQYSFRLSVDGDEQVSFGKGTNQFEAENNAILKVMREKGAKYNSISILEVLSKETTDEWI